MANNNPTSPTSQYYGYLQNITDPNHRQLMKLVIDKLHALDTSSQSIGTVSKPLTTTMDGGGQLISSVKDPVANQDAATKVYVDRTITTQIAALKTALGKPLTSSQTTTAAPATPSDGPKVPGPGGPPPPPPPNEPPITGTLSATDVIPVSSLVFENSNDISSWAVTAEILRIDWESGGVSITHTKQNGAGRWPDQPFGSSGGNLQYTLWIVLLIGGVYYASGIIQYWFGLNANGGPPSGFSRNWVYASRWGPMQDYQPAFQENVWMFVTAGNARNDATSTVQERSQIVQIQFPSDAGGIFMT